MSNVYAERGAFFASADKQLLQCGLMEIIEKAKAQDPPDALTIDRSIKLMKALDEFERAGQGIHPDMAKGYHKRLVDCEQSGKIKQMMAVLTELFATLGRTEPDPAKPIAKLIVEHIGHAIEHMRITYYGPGILAPLLGELEKQRAVWDADSAGWPDAKAAWEYVENLVRFSVTTCEEGENPWATEEV